MKDPSTLVSPVFISDEKRLGIVEAIKGDESYRAISARFKIHASTVSKIASQHGLQRLRMAKDSCLMPVVRKQNPNAREGGIIADDAQWKARQCRMGG